MSDEALIAAADLATVERLHARIAALETERDAARMSAHDLSNQMAPVQFNLYLLLDDVRRAVALLPQEPGAALGVLVEALKEQEKMNA